MLRRTLLFVILMIIWVVLSGKVVTESGELDSTHLVMGAISSLLVVWMSGDLVFTSRWGLIQLFVRPIRFFHYVLWLMWELVLANFHVFRLAVSPGGMRDVKPRIVEFETKLQSDFAKFLLANSITLTPGTITIELRGNKLFIHAISEATAEGVGRPMEKRIAKIFGEKL